MSHPRSAARSLVALGVLAVTTLPGVATASSGADRETPRCHGKSPTIVGAGELVTGTDGDDVIYAPDSEVHALGGDDDVCAAFLVYAGPGDDHVTTGGGGAEVRGGPGDDRILVTRGYADVRAGSGDDDVVAGRGRQFVVGGPGADRISTGPGQDYLNGESGDDELRGGADEDSLAGGPGDDVAHGGPGADRCEHGVERRTSCRR